CLGKMSEVASEGRTVIFVSHNMAAIRALCSHGLWLDAGRVRGHGDAGESISLYLGEMKTAPALQFDSRSDPTKPQFRSLHLLRETCNYGETLEVEVDLISPHEAQVGIEIEIHDENGLPIIYTSTAPLGGVLLPLRPDQVNRFQLQIGPLHLA